MDEDDIRVESASKVYRKVCNELAKVAGVPAPRASSRRQEFETIKDLLDKRGQDQQKAIKMWAEGMVKAGLHPRFPRFE